MEYYKVYNDLTMIPDFKDYQGYVWFSDSRAPKNVSGEFGHKSQITENPFIIEGMLYSKESNVSIMIKHTGRYFISEIDLSKLPENKKTEEVRYLKHGEGEQFLNFCEIWLPEKDKFCEDMEVLKMQTLCFVGFDNKKNN